MKTSILATAVLYVLQAGCSSPLPLVSRTSVDSLTAVADSLEERIRTLESEVQISAPVRCTFRTAHAFTRREADAFVNSTPIIWDLSELLSPMAIVHDHIYPIQRVARHLHIGADSIIGVSIFVPQHNGANIVTVWSNGSAYWAKHNESGGEQMSQHFRGTCINQ
jgi:hypothetical protein